MGQVYQRGSIRRVSRLRGDDVWEWRYRVRGKMKQEKFKVADYPIESLPRRFLGHSTPTKAE
jgi:hypothetical protein